MVSTQSGLVWIPLSFAMLFMSYFWLEFLSFQLHCPSSHPLSVFSPWIRQKSPLSPFYSNSFYLCVEGMSAKAERGGQFSWKCPPLTQPICILCVKLFSHGRWEGTGSVLISKITRMQMSMKPFICWKCLPDSYFLNLCCSPIVWAYFSMLKMSFYAIDQRGIIALKWTSFSAGQSNYCDCTSCHFLGPGAAVIESLQLRYQMGNKMTLAWHHGNGRSLDGF